MKIYCVGGAVRDPLLGREVKDRDHVVVGGTPEEMERLGFRPVGKDFPVFLHPLTHEEYALARTERKVARGYKGFTVHAAPDVTLEQDLARRDLTINAMARRCLDNGEVGSGELIDPYGGARDLEAGLLRHVSAAFVEDPVRILRVARFAARFGFAVADETMLLMRRMVDEGEADALVPERVWQEFSRGLMEPLPVRMFEVLAQCGLLPRLLPECGFAFADNAPANETTHAVMNGLAFAARQGYGIEVRFSLLAYAMVVQVRDDATPAMAAAPPEHRQSGARPGALDKLVARLRATNECRDAAWLALRLGGRLAIAHQAGAADRLALLEACDAFRRPARLHNLLSAGECMQFGTQDRLEQPWPPRPALSAALAAALTVDAATVAADASSAGADIAAALRRARTQAIQSMREAEQGGTVSL